MKPIFSISFFLFIGLFLNSCDKWELNSLAEGELRVEYIQVQTDWQAGFDVNDPDVYVKVIENGTILYESGVVWNTTEMQEFRPSSLILNSEVVYRFQVWDRDIVGDHDKIKEFYISPTGPGTFSYTNGVTHLSFQLTD